MRKIKIRNNITFIITVVVFILFFTISIKKCKKETIPQIEELDTISETIPIPSPSKDIAYYIPSPQITRNYLKSIGIYPNKTLVNSYRNIDKYTTSETKALALGIYIVDLGYLNLYNEDENTENYIRTVSRLGYDLGLGALFSDTMYRKFKELRYKPDSLQRYLSYLFVNVNDYLKNNSQQMIAALLITGCWMESFYLLCETYKEESSSELLTFIYQQKFILDNLIQIIKVYYNTSDLFDFIINNLIEMAYNFDVLDFHYSYSNPAIKKENDQIIIQNKCEITGSAVALEKIINITGEIRNKIVN